MSAMFTPAMLAERWDCTPGYILKLIKTGALPALTIGKLSRVRAADVEAFEATGGTRPTKEPCDVYVVRCEDFVKIGKASDANRRIAEIQLANPFALEVVAVLTECDGHRVEKDLHRRFAQHNHRGEWFRMEGALAEWIDTGCRDT